MPVDPRERDPRFPNRPRHEDFYLLSEVVQELDEKAGSVEDLFAEIGIDAESVRYMIDQRVTRGTEFAYKQQEDPAIRLMVLLKMLWLDGFVIGQKFTERRREEKK